MKILYIYLNKIIKKKKYGEYNNIIVTTIVTTNQTLL